MTLHLYFARRFVMTVLGTVVLFGILLYLAEIVDNLRSFQDNDATIGRILGITLLSIPKSLYRILPLLMVIASITLFISMARSSELVIARASGRSAMRSLASPIFVAVLLGIFSITVINPIVASTQKQEEVERNRLKAGPASTLSVNAEGLWLRQGDTSGQTVIRAGRADLEGTSLSQVTLFGFAPDGAPTFRIEAQSARLGDGYWNLENVKTWSMNGPSNPERESQFHANFKVTTDLTPDQIRDSFGTPSAISIWELPRFIARLEAAGFSALSHRVWMQGQFALPLSLVAMVMIAAVFTLRHTRMGRTGLLILGATLSGFAFSFLQNIATIMAENGQIPPILGAWGPSLAVILLSLGFLLHLEDG